MKLMESLKNHKVRWNLFFCVLFLLLLTVVSMLLPLGVTKYEVYDDQLPAAFDGYTILQIADLQNSTNKDIIGHAQKVQPDIIVLTGDNIYHNPSEETLSFALTLVKELIKIAPVYAVSGNHDLWNPAFAQNQQLLADLGVTHLENTGTVIKKDGAEINLMGISDPDTLDAEKSEALVWAYMAKVQATEGYDILLFHRANMLPMFEGLGFELIISGHNHGGQIRIPFLGGVKTPDGAYFPKYTEGKHKIGKDTTAIISRGIGNTVRIPRVNNPPELVVITLRREG